jgi:hypothetical protein
MTVWTNLVMRRVGGWVGGKRRMPFQDKGVTCPKKGSV